VSAPATYGCLTLLTDYGWDGTLVGVLHAVAFGLAPQLRVIDLDHSVPAHDVRCGALRLERALRHVPGGVHVAIVDPGVGSDRRPVAIETPGRVFVGPDNGLLVWAAERWGPFIRVTVLEEETFFLSGRADTFDGRDVFVPVAAHIALGLPLARLGPEVDPSTLVSLAPPVARVDPDGSLALEVVDVDRFGNLQLASGRSAASTIGLGAGDAVLVAAPSCEAPATFGRTFSDVAEGELVLLIDSDELLALSVNGGRACDALGLRACDLVSLRRAE
jgi:S-adenosylmethionine hydrolase